MNNHISRFLSFVIITLVIILSNISDVHAIQNFNLHTKSLIGKTLFNQKDSTFEWIAPRKNFGFSIMPINFTYGRFNYQLEFQPFNYFALELGVITYSKNILTRQTSNNYYSGQKYKAGIILYPFPSRSFIHFNARLLYADMHQYTVNPIIQKGYAILNNDTIYGTYLASANDTTIHFNSLGIATTIGTELNLKSGIFFRFEMGIQLLPFNGKIFTEEELRYLYNNSGLGQTDINRAVSNQSWRWYIGGFGSLIIFDFSLGYKFGNPSKRVF